MSRKKKTPAARTPTQIRWEFDPDIPTYDFCGGHSLDDLGHLQEVVDNFVYHLEEGRFLMWEAVIFEEQGLALTREQKQALRNLLSFNHEDDEEENRTLYVDEMPRPSEPWHVILNKIAPHILVEPFQTFDVHYDVQCDGWEQITTALQEYGQHLSLPPGVESAEMVVPAEVRHKLWLQCCFDALGGLGQEADLTLEDPEQQERIDWFIEGLRHCKESVAYFGLTLDSLLTRLILRAKDQPILVKLMQEKLGLSSPQEPIAEHL